MFLLEEKGHTTAGSMGHSMCAEPLGVNVKVLLQHWNWGSCLDWYPLTMVCVHNIPPLCLSLMYMCVSVRMRLHEHVHMCVMCTHLLYNDLLFPFGATEWLASLIGGCDLDF